MNFHPPVGEEGDVFIKQLICLVIVADGFIKVFGLIGSIALLLGFQSFLLALQLGLPLQLLLRLRLGLGRLLRRSRLSRSRLVGGVCGA